MALFVYSLYGSNLGYLQPHPPDHPPPAPKPVQLQSMHGVAPPLKRQRVKEEMKVQQAEGHPLDPLLAQCVDQGGIPMGKSNRLGPAKTLGAVEVGTFGIC